MKTWIWKRMIQTSWVGGKSNEQVVEEVNEHRLLLISVGTRRENFIWHVLRHYQWLSNIYEGRMRSTHNPIGVMKIIHSEMDLDPRCFAYKQCVNFQFFEIFSKSLIVFRDWYIGLLLYKSIYDTRIKWEIYKEENINSGHQIKSCNLNTRNYFYFPSDKNAQQSRS